MKNAVLLVNFKKSIFPILVIGIVSLLLILLISTLSFAQTTTSADEEMKRTAINNWIFKDEIKSDGQNDSGPDIFGVAWHPKGDYALLVGRNCVYKFNGSDYKMIPIPLLKGSAILHCVAFHPSGNYALIGGISGNLLKYENDKCVMVEHNYEEYLMGIDFKPNGDYALIVTFQGSVLKWDGNGLTNLNCPYPMMFSSVAWRPDGSYALLSGIGTSIGPDLKLLKWDERIFMVVYIGNPRDWFYDISWKNDGSYAIIAGFRLTSGYMAPQYGKVWIYEDRLIPIGASNIYTGEEFDYEYMEKTAFRPDGKYAIVIGNDIVSSGVEDGNYSTRIWTCTDGKNLEITWEGKSPHNFRIAWKPDSSYALVTANYGKIMKTDGKSVTVIPIPNEQPTVNISVNNTPRQGEKVWFTANAVDADGWITRYEWDFDNDGLFDFNSSGNKANFTYTKPGDYLVTCRVYDNSGANTTATIKIHIEGGFDIVLASFGILIVIIIAACGIYYFKTRHRSKPHRSKRAITK